MVLRYELVQPEPPAVKRAFRLPMAKSVNIEVVLPNYVNTNQQDGFETPQCRPSSAALLQGRWPQPRDALLALMRPGDDVSSS